MQLTDEQKKAVKEWVGEGCGLSEVQRRLAEQFKLSMTYMDVRFLMIDLGMEVKDKARVSKSAEITGREAVPAGQENVVSGDGNAPSGGVAVELDKITKPGFLVSGTVRFGDGVSAGWSLDQFGRLMLQPSNEGYRPSEEDLREFQTELKKQLEKRGF